MSNKTSNVIKAGEGFTIDQILNSDGFTLDTGDFADLIDEEDDFDFKKTTQLSNEEILKFLSLQDDSDEKEVNENEHIPFVGIAFDTLKPKMKSIYGNGEILKLIKTEGHGETIPKDAQVTVEYVGYFEHQDEPFDSTFYMRDKKAILRLGRGQVLQGLEIAICSMKKFEKALFIIQPSLAYGELGCLPRVPPNAEVLFKIDLIDFLDNGQADMYDELSNEEKKRFPVVEKIIRDLMTTAADTFKRQKTKQAIREYMRAVNYLESARLENDEEEREMNRLLTRALTNLTVCYNKVSKPKLACAMFQKLPVKNDGKAYFQYGKALSQLGDYDEAMKALQKAHNLCPSSADVLREIRVVEENRQKYLDYSKRFAQNSLKLKPSSETDEFEQVAIEMCDSFINDENLMKQQIPHGLSSQEQDCIRRVAALRGLTITKLNRYNDETLYLAKKSIYSRERL
ncbi:inactive peptidyl-prolyl cis-trans isomerase FKBP6 [Copidosoma floridanum]|uniref:inactive peptidyl-prolyl cis-trans isomerase FKBP6 n=1 Tax=Copidosoma floridanum TaxID=29053 RepID=UPI0006C9C17A|nr:inactive peptidyl-prolyl cis-trans isomerase FKBP6 [Copidosoma floridanum]